MLYMLDTDTCSYIIRNRPQHVKEKLEEVERNHTIGLSSVVVSELFYGAYKKGSRRLVRLVESFVDYFEIYDYDLRAAVEYGRLRAELERKGITIGAYDLQIAAHAISLNAVLVTNNLREFERIKGLKVESWV
ncbi:type II toxin-antitoxin system VapC family toxin [Hydrogenivirga sp. 128-5-R1-1]|uniref:type II toxin-antitoxin system tRNA(fMet)-specific endonuclease VapC n=1 Tax=Hydrogenivirga sp. 128-5-R1-1 TaxID=392423 RepID=UPI00015F3391|nr:type II toxin-antitoxin system VapC family toxin [Hydrogenivirga sp. 128-5-R1-1]EDP74837.1 hypothetical protein HG1285_13252 [Hydrogenivirga sp. 128-5-R1-1]